jgi:alpha-aminoadipic semialdehyde synthase
VATRIGIRREDKSPWERRAPLTPDHVRTLVERGLTVVVEPSDRRVFPDADYLEAGAVVGEDLASCPVVFAVKEIPTRTLAPDGTYIYFAHVIKGQSYNMPMLRHLLDNGCTLIDYEKVTDDEGRRLILFGRHAGLAGMIDTLWTLGRRLEAEGRATPFAAIRPAHEYDDLDAAKAAVSKAGEAIGRDGLPESLTPMVFGFAGYGNVSQGAQEIFDLLPHAEVPPERLEEVSRVSGGPALVKVVFEERHMVVPVGDGPFDLQEYYKHPERYEGVFASYVPHLTVLMNCVYWSEQYPRLVTRELLAEMFDSGRTPRLRVIGDISCDVEGGIECTLKATQPDDPVYVYLPDEDRIVSGVEGHGPVVLAVDNLPAELPVESSRDFGDALLPFVEAIARADYDAPLDAVEIPDDIRRAVIVLRGNLTPDFSYLSEHLKDQEGES